MSLARGAVLVALAMVAGGTIAVLAGPDTATETSAQTVDIETWRPPGAPPLADHMAAARVTPAAEIRPENRPANRRQPSDAELAAFHAARYRTGSNRGRFADSVMPVRRRVTGRFSGTTDEILQWAAHKWGIPEDVLRAVAVRESSWRQSAVGDRARVDDASQYPEHSRISETKVYESLGLMQIKWRPDGSLHPGTEPLRWRSTAFNADYHAAMVRFFYDGGANTWYEPDSSYGPGQAWNSLGAWYQPSPWRNREQLTYIDNVKSTLANRLWEQPWFIKR